MAQKLRMYTENADNVSTALSKWMWLKNRYVSRVSGKSFCHRKLYYRTVLCNAIFTWGELTLSLSLSSFGDVVAKLRSLLYRVTKSFRSFVRCQGKNHVVIARRVVKQYRESSKYKNVGGTPAVTCEWSRWKINELAALVKPFTIRRTNESHYETAVCTHVRVYISRSEILNGSFDAFYSSKLELFRVRFTRKLQRAVTNGPFTCIYMHLDVKRISFVVRLRFNVLAQHWAKY